MIFSTPLFSRSSFFQNVSSSYKNSKPMFSNSSSLKNAFEKLLFCDKLLLTVRLTVDMKQRVQFFRRSAIVASEWRDLGQKRVIVYIKTLPATYFTKENWH